MLARPARAHAADRTVTDPERWQIREVAAGRMKGASLTPFTAGASAWTPILVNTWKAKSATTKPHTRRDDRTEGGILSRDPPFFSVQL